MIALVENILVGDITRDYIDRKGQEKEIFDNFHNLKMEFGIPNCRFIFHN